MALADLRTIFTDAAMSREFQEFAIDMGIQSISMFARIALTPKKYASGSFNLSLTRLG